MSPSPPSLLDQPLRWTSWAIKPEIETLLAGLQANILKGHGRDHTANLFVAFAGMQPAAIKALIRRIEPLVTSALDQLRGAQRFAKAKVDGGPVLSVLLARGAYTRLGLDTAALGMDAAFRGGMRARGADLKDPPPAHWKPGPFGPAKPEPDMMVLIADETPAIVEFLLEEVQALLGGTGAAILGVEKGRAFRKRNPGGNPEGEGLEHFGYVDGRSQPLFLAEDVKAELDKNESSEGTEGWSPAFNPGQFILRDPASNAPGAFGSYFVFRKLEQDVRGFKQAEKQLATALQLSGDDAERAGALVVGRFEDGTPVLLSPEERGGKPPNNFGFDKDRPGRKCPFQSHIRKTNPRGDSVVAGGASLLEERSHIMARRGITYGERPGHTLKDGFVEAEGHEPSGNVGLLFMAYMADIAAQFEFTQSLWANNTDFVKPLFQKDKADPGPTGVDPVIGQTGGAPRPATLWHDGHSGKQGDFAFEQFVTLQGGEYFFAPSLPFLRSL